MRGGRRVRRRPFALRYTSYMKVLAIDPGYGRCGIAIVERRGVKDFVVHSECIETDVNTEFNDRLRHVVTVCALALEKHKPDSLALEKLYFGANKTTALKVAEVRGAILSLAVGADVPVFEYAPNEIKIATTGFGAADKRAMAAMIHALVKIDTPIRLDDEYDAIAIGITHLATYRPSFKTVKELQ